MKSIALFNNKGGVGKTTLLCNIAAYLKKREEKRVLIVDADPQCNASTYVMGDDEVFLRYIENSDESLHKIINKIKKGEGYVDANSIPVLHSNGFDVDIILGDTRLSVAEDFLSKDWIDAANGEPRGLKTTFVFYEMLRSLESRYDFVLFDVGPSLGAINRTVLIACDYFIMPMSSDVFCIKAIDNIATSLKNWTDGLAKGLATYEENENEDFSLRGVPVAPNLRFLGYVNQQYTAKTQGGVVRPVKAYDKIIRQMPSRITQKLKKFYPENIKTNELKLGDIPNFNSLIPLSQLSNKPIFLLGGQDGVVGAHFSKVREYEEVMKSITRNILININRYDKLA